MSSSSGPYARKSSSAVEPDQTQERDSKVAREQAEPEPKAEAEAEAWRRNVLGGLLEKAFLDSAERSMARRRARTVTR